MLLGLKEIVNDLDLLAEDRIFSEAEIIEIRDCKQCILEIENLAKLNLIQKSRNKWINTGYENSRLFS